MAISVVQFKAIANATSGNFNSAVTTGNTVILWVNSYNTSGTSISSSNPQYNGGSVTGAVSLFAVQNSAANRMYSAVWMLPNVASSGTSVSFTLTGGLVNGNMGFSIAELSGLGSSPSLDTTIPNPSTNSANAGATPLTSGATGNIVGAPELIVGGIMTDDAPANPGAPWTALAPSSFCWSGYQVAISSGGSYTFSVSDPAGADYGAGVVAIAATPAASGTVQPRATVPVPRRRPARGIWGGVQGQAFVKVPAPAQQFRLAPRRTLARAVWRGSAPFLGFVAVPAPKRPPVTVFRRVLARGQWRGGAGQAFVAVPAPRQLPYLPPRRKPARGVWGGLAGQAFVAVPAPKRVPPVPRRVLARAVWRGLAVPLAPGVAVPAPRQVPPIARRRPSRAYVQFRAVATVNAAFVPHGQVFPAPDDKSHLKKLFYLL